MRAIKFTAMLLAILVPGLAAAQQKKVERVPAKPTSAASGKEMYMEYSASCHGRSGKGDGPAASALKAAPTDLTQLAAKNAGSFPEAKVAQAIKAGPDIPAHGSQEMPVWGSIFSRMNPSSAPEGEVQLRIRNLTKYIKSLQAK